MRWGSLQGEKLTLGIIFLGTPLANWSSLGLNIARLGDLNEGTLSGQVICDLDELSSLFNRILDPAPHWPKTDTIIYFASFYEELPTPGIGFVSFYTTFPHIPSDILRLLQETMPHVEDMTAMAYTPLML